MTTRTLEADVIESLEVGKSTGASTGTLPPLVSTKKKILKRFFRHKLAVLGLILLSIFYLAIIFADFLAPYRMDSADRSKPYLPPTKIHLFHNGKFVGPFIYDMIEQFDPKTRFNKYVPQTDKIYKIKFFTAGEEYKLLGFIKLNIHLFGVDKPARIAIWGSDLQGRDIFSRILFGGRISLTIGLMAICISYPLGLIMGGISGYFGGMVDNIIMRVVEAIMTFPSLFLLLTLAATLPKNLTSVQRYIFIILILCFIGWAGQARIYRGQVLSLKQMEYVEAARAIGLPSFLIIIKHIIPQMTSWIIVAATISIPAYTLGEAYLSFLGLGIQDPQASWGLMLQEARNVNILTTKPWLLIPGFAIVSSVFAFNFFGDGLRDAFDAKKQI